MRVSRQALSRSTEVKHCFSVLQKIGALHTWISVGHTQGKMLLSKMIAQNKWVELLRTCTKHESHQKNSKALKDFGFVSKAPFWSIWNPPKMFTLSNQDHVMSSCQDLSMHPVVPFSWGSKCAGLELLPTRPGCTMIKAVIASRIQKKKNINFGMVGNFKTISFAAREKRSLKKDSTVGPFYWFFADWWFNGWSLP